MAGDQIDSRDVAPDHAGPVGKQDGIQEDREIGLEPELIDVDRIERVYK